MRTAEPKKGLESLTADYYYWLEREPGRKEEWRQKYEWALNRAEQYAARLGTDRETVLKAWEEDRDYWYVNYYQECNQPDLTGMIGAVTLAEWLSEGERLYGKEKLDWRFRCPACGHVQTMRQFKEAGLDPELAYLNCASRHKLGGKPDCKWTIGGLLRVGGRYVIDAKYRPHLIFEFADKETKED
ncbi:MAG: hypothetical protein IJ767_04100 [Bacteroidaceae bacterium]|nr:hypothetical protein [Bacteroidaceae bacterium]